MKKLIGLTLAVVLLATGSAEAHHSGADYDPQGLAAAVALLESASPYVDRFSGEQGFCKWFKHNRARCGEKITATRLEDGSPVRCGARIIVSLHWWRFPPQWFGCPVEWRPTG